MHTRKVTVMKIIINPTYQHLTKFIESLPQIFEYQGNSIYKARNEIKTFVVDGTTINVKSYQKPILINRIAYTFFRKTKAERAYKYAFELMKRGINTPTPIAYIEIKTNGLLSKSFFVSLHTPLEGNLRLFGDEDRTLGGREELVDAFAKFSAEIHSKGVLHIDYSPGNVLYEKKNNEYHFSLIDINRMKFKDVGIVEGCSNFARMVGNVLFFERIAKTYARERGFEYEECRSLMLKYRTIDRKKRAKKNLIKKKLKS